MRTVATFSIVACDLERGEWGVAVQSKFLAAAAVVSWARAGAGAVATQARANMSFGPRGLGLLAQGLSAQETGERLLAGDSDCEVRQLGLVDRAGHTWAFTGSDCQPWAGHVLGESYACQGNILVPGTVEAMAAAFEKTRRGEGELADWLVVALAAGQAAGGDSRGRQAAGLLVVREGGSYGGTTDRYIDLRVDDDPQPIEKLRSLLRLHHLYFGKHDSGEAIPVAEVADDLQQILRMTGDYNGPLHGTFDTAACQALKALISRENLEERWDGESEIDVGVLSYLREKFNQ